MAKYHALSEADVTIATIPVDARDATGFGIMKVNKGGYIETFVEKPAIEELPPWKSEVSEQNKAAGREYLASMGIYIFSKGAIKKLFGDHPDSTDFGKQIIPAAIQSGYKVASYQYDGYWTDIGSIRSFYEANIELTDSIPKFNLFDNHSIIYTRPRLLAPSKFFDTTFDRTVVAEGCIIHAKVIRQTVVGIRARIGEGTVVDRAVIMGNDYFQTLEEITDSNETIPMGIGNNCHIEQAIIDKNCRIGNDVVIRGDKSLENVQTDTYCIVEGIIVLRKGAVIPAGTKIGKVAEEIS